MAKVTICDEKNFTHPSLQSNGYVVRNGHTFVADSRGSGWTSKLDLAHVFTDRGDASRVAEMWEQGGHATEIHRVVAQG